MFLSLAAFVPMEVHPVYNRSLFSQHIFLKARHLPISLLLQTCWYKAPVGRHKDEISVPPVNACICSADTEGTG